MKESEIRKLDNERPEEPKEKQDLCRIDPLILERVIGEPKLFISPTTQYCAEQQGYVPLANDVKELQINLEEREESEKYRTYLLLIRFQGQASSK